MSLAEYVRQHCDDDEIDADGVFVSLSKRTQMFKLNLAASIIFEGLIEGVEGSKLLAIFLDVFEITEGKAQSDIDSAIETFIEKGIFIEKTL
jgi:hypothetical protein